MQVVSSRLIFFLFFYISDILISQNIQLNEIVSSNATIIKDEDGDYPDWIEIFNNSGSNISIDGFSLSDDLNEIGKWTFPAISMKPKSFLVVFASGKNKLDFVITWDAIIKEADDWFYFVGSSEPTLDWNTSLIAPSDWNVGASGFGYGDSDDNTVIEKTLSVYVRKNFQIDDPKNIAQMIFHLDYDDGYIAYLNGKEFSRANMGPIGSSAFYNTSASDLHEAEIKSGGFPNPIFIDLNEFALNQGENILAVQVHNYNMNSSDLSCIPMLTIGYNVEKSDFRNPDPRINLPNSFLHTNFKIKSEGEDVVLSNASGKILDSYNSGYIPTDRSKGRIKEGDTWSFFEISTPGQSNDKINYQGFLNSPNINVESGFYNSPQNISITHQDENARIYYTIDGNQPDQNSQLFSNTITVNENMVVRAIAIRDGWSNSEIITKSYIFDDDYDLPSIFLTIKPDDFFNPDTGIYVKGPDAENSYPYFGANFWKDIEKPVHFEILDLNEKTYNADAGVKIFGAWSRGHAQKSLSLFARKKYGPSAFDYKFFNDIEIENFEALVLRNSGNDWNSTMLRDGYVATLIRDVDVDHLSYRPVQMYLNGNYWGIHNLREKTNEHFIASHYGIDVDDIDIIGLNNSEPNNIELIHGSSSDYYDLHEFISNRDLSNESHFSHITSKIDMESYINYHAIQIFIDNRDWPGNNVKLWKDNRINGKWRWILYDTDFGFGLNSPLIAHEFNTLKFALEPNGPFWPNPPWSTLFLRKLLQNDSFKNQFINVFSDRLNTIFKPQNLNIVLDSLKNDITSFIPKHNQRWGTMQSWNSEINEIKNFNNERSAYVRRHLEEMFELPDSKNLFLKIFPSNSGKIKINSIVINDNLWAGSYYPGTPISIKAIPKKGYRFLKWEESSITHNEINHDLSDNNTLTAVFEIAEENENSIVITEINYSSSEKFDSGDWVEIYNKSESTIDLNGWSFKDNDNSHTFIFDNNSLLEPGSYMVLSNDPSKIKSKFSNLKQLLGPFDFGLGKDDQVRIYNNNEKLVDSVHYQNIFPWPLKANGGGSTLELINPLLDNSNHSSWIASTEYGSPGYKVLESQNLSIEDEMIVPREMVLLQPYPNPFNNSLIIPIEVNTNESAVLVITNLLGQRIKSFDLKKSKMGKNKIIWNTRDDNNRDISSGIYIVTLKTNSKIESQKVLFLK